MEDILQKSNINSSFEKDVNKIKIFENLLDNEFDFRKENEKPLLDKSKINIEEIDLNEINDILKEMDKSTSKIINYSHDNINIKSNNESHEKECNEIISILKRPFSNKEVCHLNLGTPFKPLSKPKKVSMIGKIIYNVSSEDNTTIYLSQNDNIINE